RVADATIANVFIIKEGRLSTPPLSEGPVDGVMRRHLLTVLPGIAERPLNIDEIMEADEIFLTNAISGIKWVREFQGKAFRGEQTAIIYHEHVKAIWK
ncbi:MAG TPA: aminotransferase class IV, partial [Chryseolinea sp.]|nr:aminotransferase class IV [Chryseolinea sp.]